MAGAEMVCKDYKRDVEDGAKVLINRLWEKPNGLNSVSGSVGI